MANQTNLISIKERTTKEQREIASKGGKASGKARRRNRVMRDIAKTVFSSTTKS